MSDETKSAQTVGGTTPDAPTAKAAPKKAAGAEQDNHTVIAPLAWLVDPESGDVFAASTPSDVANMRSRGFTDAEKPPEGMPEAKGADA